MFVLVVEHGPHHGETFSVSCAKTIVGRLEESDLTLNRDQTVSRRHCEINLVNQRLMLQDLGSTSGTIVNGTRVHVGVSVPVEVGDSIFIGQSLLRVTTQHLQSKAIQARGADSVPKPPVLAEDQCRRCHQKFSFIGKAKKSAAHPGVCNGCGAEIDALISRFRRTLQGELNFWSGMPDDLDKMIRSRAADLSIDYRTALAQSADVTKSFLQRVLTFLLTDGHLSQEEESVFHGYRKALNLAPEHIPDLMGQANHYAFLRDLHEGKLPSIKPSMFLPSGEIAHIEVQATYYRELSTRTEHHSGRLVVTNSRLIFNSHGRPFEASLSKVSDITFCPPRHLELQLTRKQGTGVYECQQAFYFVEVLRAVLELHLRHRVLAQSDSRAIPHAVKSAVYQRDGGQCVQCGEAQYLEFDHVIPFSKGGATSVNNLQLLCRRCNLAKSSKL